MNRNHRRKLGATGEFPRGKLSAVDEGELVFGVAVQDKTVIITFGKPISWFGMDKQAALALGRSIIKKAESI